MVLEVETNNSMKYRILQNKKIYIKLQRQKEASYLKKKLNSATSNEIK